MYFKAFKAKKNLPLLEIKKNDIIYYRFLIQKKDTIHIFVPIEIINITQNKTISMKFVKEFNLDVKNG